MIEMNDVIEAGEIADEIADEIIELMKKRKLTYYQAEVVLETCKFSLKKTTII